MSVSGPYFSYGQLQQLWIQAGGPRAVAPVAAAIALAESEGGAGALNPTDNHGQQTSWGIWQISNGTHNQPVPNILDPTVNAKAAVAKYTGAGNSFSPWGTYTSGAYRAHLQSGVGPSSAGVPAGGPGGAVTLTADTTPEPGSAFSPCLLGIPTGVPYVGGACLLTKTEARAVVGTLLLGTGVVLGVVALVLLATAAGVPSPARLLPRPAKAAVDEAAGKTESEQDGDGS